MFSSEHEVQRLLFSFFLNPCDYLVLTSNQGNQYVSSYSHTASVLFVCLGNICRSPSAHAVFRAKVKQHHLAIDVDSAGTAAYHVGAKPDQRSQQAGEARGYDFKGLTARRVSERDFEQFDLVLAMDKSNYNDLIDRCPEKYQHKVKLMMEFAQHHLDQDEVPDPYYGGAAGFEYVLDLIEDASDGIIMNIQKEKVN